MLRLWGGRLYLNYYYESLICMIHCENNGFPVKSIDDGFLRNSNVKILNLPANLTSFSYDGLHSQFLTTINVDSSNPYATSQDGVLYNKRSYQNSNNDCKQYQSDIKRVLFSVIGKWHSFIVFRLTVLFRSNHFMFRIRHCHLKIFNGST